MRKHQFVIHVMIEVLSPTVQKEHPPSLQPRKAYDSISNTPNTTPTQTHATHSNQGNGIAYGKYSFAINYSQQKDANVGAKMDYIESYAHDCASI